MDKLKSKLSDGPGVMNMSRQIVIEITNLTDRIASIFGTKMRYQRLN